MTYSEAMQLAVRYADDTGHDAEVLHERLLGLYAVRRDGQSTRPATLTLFEEDWKVLATVHGTGYAPTPLF